MSKAAQRLRRTLTAGILAATVLVLTVLTGCGGGESGNGFVAGRTGMTQVDPPERTKAPVAAGTGLDGQQVSTEHPGKVVVINVWGSWCAPCRQEAPDLQRASEQTADVAQFVGIDTRDPDPGPARAFQRSFGITYPSIHDPQGQSLLQFSGDLPPSGIPSTLVLDTEGRIAARVIGVVDEKTLVALVRDVAAGK